MFLAELSSSDLGEGVEGRQLGIMALQDWLVQSDAYIMPAVLYSEYTEYEPTLNVL